MPIPESLFINIALSVVGAFLVGFLSAFLLFRHPSELADLQADYGELLECNERNIARIRSLEQFAPALKSQAELFDEFGLQPVTIYEHQRKKTRYLIHAIGISPLGRGWWVYYRDQDSLQFWACPIEYFLSFENGERLYKPVGFKCHKISTEIPYTG